MHRLTKGAEHTTPPDSHTSSRPTGKNTLTELEPTDIATQIATMRPDMPAVANRPRSTFSIATLSHWQTNYWHLTVEVDPDFARTLERPAQYTTVGVEGLEPKFLVISSVPGDTTWEFIISKDSSLGLALSDLSPGAPVVLSHAEGEGFDLEALEGQEILGFATGSGVATLRPVFKTIARREPERLARMALYYGEQREQDFILAAEFDAWEREGARIYRVSEDGLSGDAGWRYVQHAFLHDAPDLSSSVALLSGAPVMLQMVSQLLIERGLAPSSILTNI